MVSGSIGAIGTPPITTLGGQMMAVHAFATAPTVDSALALMPRINEVAQAMRPGFVHLEVTGEGTIKDFRRRVVPGILSNDFRPNFVERLGRLPGDKNPTQVWKDESLDKVDWLGVRDAGVVTEGAIRVFFGAMLEKIEPETIVNMKTLRDLPGIPRASNLWIYGGALLDGPLGYWLGGDSLVSICALTLLLGTGFALFGRDIRDGRTERALMALESDAISGPSSVRAVHARFVELLRLGNTLKTVRMLLDPPRTPVG